MSGAPCSWCGFACRQEAFCKEVRRLHRIANATARRHAAAVLEAERALVEYSKAHAAVLKYVATLEGREAAEAAAEAHDLAVRAVFEAHEREGCDADGF